MSDWIPVSEELPDDSAVLTWNGSERCIDYYIDNEWCNENLRKIIDFDEREDVTHWMPLPEPPT